MTPLLSLLVLAADAAPAADAPINPVVGALLALLALAIPFALRMLKWVKEKALTAAEGVENEYVRGLLKRLTDEIDGFASLVGTAAAEYLLDTKRPDSPGGSVTTKEELDEVGRKILAKLADHYGGFDKLLDLAVRIGLGSNPAEAQAALLSKINFGVAKTVATDERLGRIQGP